MKLFEIVPENLFSILASKNKNIYLEALFVLRKAFKQEMLISKADLIAMLIANLDEMMLEMDFAAEDDLLEEGSPIGGKSLGTLSAAAHFLLRRLKDTGWVESEYQTDSFEESITLPDYSVKIINLLFSLTEEQTAEYNSLVYSAYSDLRTADQERDEYMFTALVSARDKTVQLVDELKTLHNNIRRYHQALNDYASVNDVLKGHFDEYKTLISDRIYHPLKTFDSVPRFRTPILKILGEWLADQGLRDKMAGQAVLRGRYATQEEAQEGIILMISEITDIYERLDEMLQEIDRKNSAYTRASMEKMQYLLNTDRSIKGKIVDLLLRLASDKGQEDSQFANLLADGVQLYRQEYLDAGSLYLRENRRQTNESSPLEAREPAEDNSGQELKNFLAEAKNTYSHNRVMRYVRELLQDKDVINSAEIGLTGDEDFILLMLAALKGSTKNTFYSVEFLEGYQDNNGYRIPALRFVRKEKKHVE